ncbi:hypothetical protein IKZ40_06565 [bacterium]|nr:hypothetical protein [bacterium]
MLNELQLKLCDIQGRLFELSGERKLPSELFIKTFMRSFVAKGLDSAFNRLQWAGEEYLLAETEDLAKDAFEKPGEVFDKDRLYWMGYLYRYWHYYTGENSAKIYRQAPAKTMKRNYPMFHTFAPELAIKDLKEISAQKSKGTPD